jgi:HSP20 family protein
MLAKVNPFEGALQRWRDAWDQRALTPFSGWDDWAELDVFPKGFGATDVAEDEHTLTVKVDMPGLNAKDIDIQAEKGVLTIRTERNSEKEEKNKKYHRVERSYGSFCRSFRLPSTVDTEKVSAEYKDGVLRVEMPKSEEARAKKIEVTAI